MYLCFLQCISPWIYPIWDSLHFLDLGDYFLIHVRKSFDYNHFKCFLRPFLFWDPYNWNVCAFNVVPEVSEMFIHFFFFILFHSRVFTILSSSLLIHSSAIILLLILSSAFFILVIVLFISVCSLVLLGLC